MVNQTDEDKAVAQETVPDTRPADLITGVPEGTAPAPINQNGYTEVDGVMEADAIAKLDPAATQVHTLTVTQLPNKTTMLSARFFGPEGWANKQHALPSPVTAQHISDALLDIGNWQ